MTISELHLSENESVYGYLTPNAIQRFAQLDFPTDGLYLVTRAQL